MTNEENWLAKYTVLREHVEAHGRLPDKHKVENRGLLNFSKYTRKKIKEGTLSEELERMLQELADSRSTEHTGGRMKSPK